MRGDKRILIEKVACPFSLMVSQENGAKNACVRGGAQKRAFTSGR
jgi:hypothetical protein